MWSIVRLTVLSFYKVTHLFCHFFYINTIGVNRVTGVTQGVNRALLFSVNGNSSVSYRQTTKRGEDSSTES